MLRTLVQIIKLLFYGALILLGVTFAVSNRTMVDLTFYPIPYKIQLPLFLFAIVVFSVGIIIGWMVARWAALKHHYVHVQTRKRAEALENEIVALRSEQSLKATTLPRS